MFLLCMNECIISLWFFKVMLYSWYSHCSSIASWDVLGLRCVTFLFLLTRMRRVYKICLLTKFFFHRLLDQFLSQTCHLSPLPCPMILWKWFTRFEGKCIIFINPNRICNKSILSGYIIICNVKDSLWFLLFRISYRLRQYICCYDLRFFFYRINKSINLWISDSIIHNTKFFFFPSSLLRFLWWLLYRIRAHS